MFFVPATKSVLGYQCTCDLCDRVLGVGEPDKLLSLAEWKPIDGIPQLATQLGIPIPSRQEDSDAKIESLLRSATECSTPQTLDISLGLKFGCVLGVLIGAAIGYSWLPQLLQQMDRFGCVAAGILGGLVLGGIIGAVLATLIQSRRVPFQKIKSGIEKYSLDGNRIVQVADQYPQRIRNAALRARDRTALTACGPA